MMVEISKVNLLSEKLSGATEGPARRWAVTAASGLVDETHRQRVRHRGRARGVDGGDLHADGVVNVAGNQGVGLVRGGGDVAEGAVARGIPLPLVGVACGTVGPGFLQSGEHLARNERGA